MIRDGLSSPALSACLIAGALFPTNSLDTAGGLCCYMEAATYLVVDAKVDDHHEPQPLFVDIIDEEDAE